MSDGRIRGVEDPIIAGDTSITGDGEGITLVSGGGCGHDDVGESLPIHGETTTFWNNHHEGKERGGEELHWQKQEILSVCLDLFLSLNNNNRLFPKSVSHSVPR